MFDASLLAEAVDHLGDQRPVIFDHLVFERHPDQVALGQRRVARGFEQRFHVVLGVEVGAARAGEHNHRGNPNRQSRCHAAERRLHPVSHWNGRMMAHSARPVNVQPIRPANSLA